MIRDFLKKYGWRYAPGILFLVVNAYAASWTPSFLGRAIDGLSAESIDRAYVMRQIVGLVGAAILVFAARYIWRYFIIGNARYLEIFIRERLFRKMQHMPASFFDENPTGDLMAMAINDIGAVRMTAGMVVSQLLTGASTAVFSLRKMLVEIPAPLALSALIPVAVSIAGVVILGGRIRQKFGRVQQLYARISGTIQENIMGMRVLKAFHREAPAQAQVQQKSAEMRDANIDLADTSALLNPMIQILFGVSFLISLTYGSSMVLDGRITVGSLVAFNDYLLMIMAPVVSLGRIINAAARGRASYRRLNAIFAQPEVPAREYAPCPPLRGDIAVHHLTYAYPGTARDVLRDVSFDLPVGKVLGIVGETGCGKTTLIDLLLKFRDAPPGTVTIDGRDLTEIPAHAIRAAVGYVPQEEFLFQTSVRENIRFYEPVDDAAIDRAAEAADLKKDLGQLADGYDTDVGERGRHLSGGQKKRVTIARALVRQPKILIFDDVLSSVDVQTEQRILAQLDRVMRGKTCIVISQRISALQHADEILYMQDGTVLERGTHAQLMAQNGAYAAMARAQSRAADDGVDLLA